MQEIRTGRGFTDRAVVGIMPPPIEPRPVMRRILPVVFVACTLSSACRQPPQRPDVTTTPPTTTTPISYVAPQRLILFIGDGMGVGQITAAMYANGAPLQMLEMPHLGFMTTHEYEYLTTDSAASATAISTGRKTSYEAVSVTPGTTEANQLEPARHMQTLLELAKADGLRTGIVTTSRVNHATPAAFGGHRFSREAYEDIADDFTRGHLDVVIGPGEKYFDQRKDGRDLLAEMAQAGWATARSAEELDAVDASAERVMALLQPGDYPFVSQNEPRAMALDEMVTRAIDVLDRGQSPGWVLMVEGSFVDWCAHNLDGPCAAMEVLDLDAAVSRARTYASKRDDTLVVVTADHETGGMSLIDPYYSDRFAKILGGEEAATKLVAHPDVDGKPVDAPPPFQHFAIGGRNAELAAAPLPNPNLLGMTELNDGRASVVMGHFSMASRPFWKSRGRFYGSHTPIMVSIHAEGPGAEEVVRATDNADLGQTLRDLVHTGASKSTRTVAAADDRRPRNVILMIGDGMGLPSITAAHYWSDGLSLVDLDVRGLVSTHATDYVVNDSAATATALATGQRTRKKAVGKIVQGSEFVDGVSVLEIAERKGLSTGLVTTTPVTHATPAAFYAHQDDRYQLAGIAADLLSLPARAGAPEIVLGGGQKDFDEAQRAALTAAGYTVFTQWPPPTQGDHLLGILADDGLLPAAQRNSDNDPSTPSLADMTQVALNQLGKNDAGFFLMVEGGQIDWRLHEGVRDTTLLAEVVDFDDAVSLVTAWARERGDTLVIVTADHDHTLSVIDNHYAFESGRCGVSNRCGGPFEMLAIPVDGSGVRHTEGFAEAALQGDFAPPAMYLQYAWPVQEGQTRNEVRAPHSANFVPLFATGPRARRFEGFQDQPTIGQQLVDWANSTPQ